jgi:tetratricopeptide (TPR) repeat protein
VKERPYDDLYRAAIVAGRERRYGEAAVLLSDLLRKSDEYPEAVLYLGRSYHALGEFARAIAVLTFFLRLAPDAVAGHFFLGRSYLALGHPQLALRYLRRATALKPGFVPALTLAGIASLKCRRPFEAVRFLQAAVEGDPDNKRVFTAYLNALLTQAIKLFRDGDLTMSGQILQFILKNHPDSVTAHVYLGRIFRDLGKPAPALRHFEAASNLAPEDASLHLQRATTLLATGAPDEAVAELRMAATSVDPKAFLSRNPAELARLLCVTYFQNRQYREAIAHGLQALKDTPDEPQVHVIVAEAFRNLGELEKARNHYERALQRNRADVDVLYGLAMVLLDQQDMAELRSVLTRIDKAKPGDPTAAYYLAICRSRLGDDPVATIGLLQAQLRERGPDPFLMLGLARDYLRAGLPELADGWFRRTLKVNPDDKSALQGLLETSTALGGANERIESLERYLSVYPQEHSLRKDLIRLRVERKEYAEAQSQIEALIPHEPNNKTLRELLATCYRHTGKYAEAVVVLKELLIAEPRAVDKLTALVYCMDRAGDRALATLLLEKALPSFPDDVGLRLILGTLFLKAGILEKAATTFRQVVTLSPGEPVAYESLAAVHRRLGDEAFAVKFEARARAARKKLDATRAAAAPKGAAISRPAAVQAPASAPRESAGNATRAPRQPAEPRAKATPKPLKPGRRTG